MGSYISQTESQYNISMQNKINFEIGAKAKIVKDVSGVDFDLRAGDEVTFEGWDEREGGNDDWKEQLASDVGNDVSRLRGAFLILDSEQCTGWFPIDVQTNTILSY